MSCRFARGIRNREEKEFVAGMITSGEVEETRVLRELRNLNIRAQDDKSTESHSEFINRSIPRLRERVANVFLEVVDDHLGPIYRSYSPDEEESHGQ